MTENITVCVRFRPINKKENEKTAVELTKNTINIHDWERNISHQFIFDHVFDHTVSQENVFKSVAKNAVEWVLEGYNSTIFAYGLTGSGKTHTIFGEKKNPGIVPRACELLFTSINANDSVIEADMKCSFIEIYKEQIRDLLDLTNVKKELRLRQSEVKGVYVHGGLLEKHVYSHEEILTLIKEGMLQRSTASTAMNNTSSRSHAILTITLFQKFSDGTEATSKLHIVDLAGSEDVSKSEVTGVALSEAQNINKSLSALGNVIYALTEKGRDHIPYRDSKLTFFLQDSLGGTSKTILISTATPSVTCFSETVNTLKFSRRVKEIKNLPKINKIESTENLLKTIEALQKQLADYSLEKPREVQLVSSFEGEKLALNLAIQEKQEKIEQLAKELESKNKEFNQIQEIKFIEINSEKEKYRNTLLTLKMEYEKNKETLEAENSVMKDIYETEKEELKQSYENLLKETKEELIALQNNLEIEKIQVLDNSNEKIDELEKTLVLLQEKTTELQKENETLSQSYESLKNYNLDLQEHYNVSEGKKKEFLEINRELEKRVNIYEKIILENQSDRKELEDLFEKQRVLSQKHAEDLYTEKVKVSVLQSEVEKYKVIFASLNMCIDTPEIFPTVMERLK